MYMAEGLVCDGFPPFRTLSLLYGVGQSGADQVYLEYKDNLIYDTLIGGYSYIIDGYSYIIDGYRVKIIDRKI